MNFWRTFKLLGSLATLVWIAACIVEDFPLENHLCLPASEANRCLDGWVCGPNNRCIKAQPDTGPPPEGKPEREVAVEEAPPPPDGERPPTEEQDGGPEVVLEDGPPDKPPLKCDYFSAPTSSECPVRLQNSCERIGKVGEEFKLASVQLPVRLAGAASVSTGTRRVVNSDPAKKMHIFLLGGGEGGAPGNKVYSIEVGDDGKLAKTWSETSPLTQARAEASAFLIGEYIYVFGGVDAAKKAVTTIERAKLKADGTLDAFASVGTWTKARAQAGITYRHGYFYIAGGVDGAGKISAEVERALLLPDGKIGPFETLPSLPEGRSGPLVSTERFLYLVGRGTSDQVLLARIEEDASLAGWCQTTTLPVEAKEFSALADGRRIFLYNIKKKDGKPHTRLYFAPIKTGDPSPPKNQPLGGGLLTWTCSEGNEVKTLLQTGRHGAAVAVAGNYLYVIGGIDGAGLTLKSTEYTLLPYRQDGRCDIDRDLITNGFDYCPDIYHPDNKNSDQSDKLLRPGFPPDKWVLRFGPGDACEPDAMLLIAAGEFSRGGAPSGDDAPSGKIMLKSFYIDATEVTNKDYNECVLLKKCTPPKDKTSTKRPAYFGEAKFANYPVIHVSWEQAKKYCEFRGKRLPTEAEWEKAARALSGAKYPWGDSDPSCQKANYKDCSDKDTVEVGTLQGASPYGAFDMVGNVREWVSDYYEKDYYKTGPAVDPPGPEKGTERVIRGGSFLTDSAGLHVAIRQHGAPTLTAPDLGFRCARSLFTPIKGQ